MTVKSHNEVKKLLDMGFDAARKSHFQLLNLGLKEKEIEHTLECFVEKLSREEVDYQLERVIQEKAA